MKSTRKALADLVKAADAFFFGGNVDDAIRNLSTLRDELRAANETLAGYPEDDSQTIILDVSTGKPIATFADLNLARWFANECEQLPDAHLRIVEVES